jgi:hypothetical protein
MVINFRFWQICYHSFFRIYLIKIYTRANFSQILQTLEKRQELGFENT